MQFKTPPRAHQKATLENFIDQNLNEWGCFWDVGSGKSYMAIQLLRWKFNLAGRVLPTLIFAPPRPVPGWKDQWLRHSNIDAKKVVLLLGTGKQRLKTFMDCVAKGDEWIFVTNYESLLMEDLFKAFQGWSPQCLIFDESHRLKSHSAKRSKQADILANPYDFQKRMRKPKPTTIILSGSPILKNPMDLFMQFKIMDGGATFGWNFFAFRARFFRDRNAGMPKNKYFPKWELMNMKTDGIDGEGELQKVMSARSNYVDKSTCLDLPPETDELVNVEMSKEQTRVYKEMQRDLVTFIKSKACVASLAITKALRLMQITSGFVPTFDDDTGDQVLVELDPNPKIEKFKELLEELLEQEQSVLVWAVFKPNYKMLRKAIQEVFDKMKAPYKFVECHGEISSSQQDKNLKAFRDDPDVRVFLGHPKSGGIGVNELMKAGVDITYSRDFSLESYIQSRGRNHRDGTDTFGHKKVVHYQLICGGTICELALKRLVNKEDVGEKLLQDIAQSLGEK